ncbi:hypothetical protein P7H62_03690 [Vagococcus carniphilus]|uniref:hypothetical protein n=1 Tax=Vagococcus carniphilus TaxID=218144 RepID=UPI00288E7D05|nr:hypothetical protein [Vagococcus carniphilus]MDT2830272.1 hypothetical protein [Vagococcus carniphilus]MDT2838704.1 hypothetical protein [Vagococcus carniphilus]MDT2853542.1 hypothetical protein [Vagococcus carniphilus]
MSKTKIRESRYTIDEGIEILKGAVISDAVRGFEVLKETAEYRELERKWNMVLIEKYEKLTYTKDEYVEGKEYDAQQTLSNRLHKVDVFNEIIMNGIENDFNNKFINILMNYPSVNNEDFGKKYCIDLIENYIETDLSKRINYIGQEVEHSYGETVL